MIVRNRRTKHTLAARLMWLYLIVTVSAVAALAITFHFTFRLNFAETVFPHFIQYTYYIKNDIGEPPNIDRATELAKKLQVKIFIRSPTFEWASDSEQIDLSNIVYKRDYTDSGIQYRYGEYRGNGLFTVIDGDITYTFSPKHSRAEISYAILPIIIILVLLLVLYHSTRGIFRPIETIASSVRRIGQGELNHRLDINREDEFGTLAKSVNSMADDIQSMLDAKRQLLLAISHELRSPLTRAKVSVAMLSDKQHQNEIDRELNEIEKLIEELLETERLSNRHRKLNITEIQLDVLITELIRDHFSVDSINVDTKLMAITIFADAARFRIMIKNLLDNAIRHNDFTKGNPEIEIHEFDNQVIIDITDFGVGIEPRHLPHITEPFYRGDSSRRRDTGGYGLGLYLCRVIAEAHGGRIEIKSAIGHGTRIRVNIPIKIQT